MKPKTFTERTLILLTKEQKTELVARAKAADVYIGDLIRDLLFPDKEQQDVQQRLAALEQRVRALEQRNP